MRKTFSAVRLLGDPGNAKGYTVLDDSIVFKDLRLLLPSGGLDELSNKTYKTIISKKKK